MAINVCPVTVIDAPVERVWDFLSVPAHYDWWWDAETETIEPDGPAQPGQVIHARTREMGRWWPITAVVEGIDPARHHIDLTTHLPLGITGKNHITCTALADGRCQVSFG
jgi:uncharacterized protein YndB with AHSA1/START domain